MVIDGFSDPFVNACFIDDNTLYICLYHNSSFTHHHFIWNLTSKSTKGKPVSILMEESKKNFPYKSFYNDVKNEIYTFYR